MARSYSAGEGRGFAQGGEGRKGAYEAKDPRKMSNEELYKARATQIYNSTPSGGPKTDAQMKAQDTKVGLLSLTKDYPNVFLPFEVKDNRNPLFREDMYQPWAQWGKYRQGEKNELDLAFELKEIDRLSGRLSSGRDRFNEVISTRTLNKLKPMAEQAKKLIAELATESESLVNDATAVVDFNEMFKDYFTKSKQGDSFARTQVEPALKRLDKEATNTNKAIEKWNNKMEDLRAIRRELDKELEQDQEYDGREDQDQSWGGRY